MAEWTVIYSASLSVNGIGSKKEQPMLPLCGDLLTPEAPRFYSGRMSAEDTNQRFDHELQRLEKRLDELVVICKQLQEENQSLKQRQDTLIEERATLLQKNEQVRARVEAMISRLKAMEQTQ
jgi:cell division protein ZapB